MVMAILVTRSDSQQLGLVQLLEAKGAEVLTLPLLRLTAPDDWGPLDRALGELEQFQWLILTSVNAVNYFFGRLADQGHGPESVKALDIAVVGTKTYEAVRALGLQPRIIPQDFDSEGLIAALQPLTWPGVRVLFPRVQRGGREVLTQTLRDWGAVVTEVAAYETRPPESLDPEIEAAFRAGRIEVVTFTSSKTVRYFVDLVADLDLSGVQFAAIGPQTAQTCLELLGRVEIVAQTYTLEGLVQALELSWGPRGAG